MTPVTPLHPTDAGRHPGSDAPTPRTHLARRGCVALLALALVVTGGILLQDSQWDLPVVASLNHMHVGWFGTFTTTVYFLFDPPGAIILSALITAAILTYDALRRRQHIARVWARAATYAATVLITWLPITILKAIFTRPRPDVERLPHPFVEYQGHTSYPSGHTSFAVISVVALFLIVATTNRTRTIVAVLGASWIVFIVLVVVSNGVHFPTDSAASIVWGLGVAPFVAGAAQRVLTPQVRIPASA